MPAAGQYSDRLQRLVRSTTKDNTTGQDQEIFTPGAYYWCSVEPVAGRRQTQYGGEQTGVDVTVRVRNWPELSALDRLYNAEWDETYIIETITRGDNETIAEGYLFDALQV